MPKRSHEEKMDHYMKKMEKLRKKRRRQDDSSSDDINNTLEGDTAMWGITVPIPGTDDIEPQPVETLLLTGPEETQPEFPLESNMSQQNEPSALLLPAPAEVLLEPAPASDEMSFPPLEPDLLSALGEATDQGPTWGPDIHNNLTQLWQPLLRKGMAKDVKDKVLKQYLIPGNCMLLQAPKINIEISAAIAEMVRLRDKKVENSQQQLGIGITAISRAMTSLLTNDNKIEAIKTLSDGCRILCDLHYSETQLRVKMITPGLAKPFLNVIQESERDETLFGVSLPEKIKASKTIEKQGLQIKKTVQVQPARTNLSNSNNTMSVRQQFQGNWAGPSRYPTRGGRGGQRKFPSSTRRPAPTTAMTTVPAQSRGRSRVLTRP